MILQSLKQVRLHNNLTMEEIAKNIGISKVAYWKIENGKTNISLLRARQIGEYLNESVDNIFISEELRDVKKGV